jgi:hypothetical protein
LLSSFSAFSKFLERFRDLFAAVRGIGLTIGAPLWSVG